MPHGVRVFIEVERHTLEGHKHSSCHLFRAKRAKWCRFAGYCTHIGGDIGKNSFGLWADATSAHMAGSAFKKYRKSPCTGCARLEKGGLLRVGWVITCSHRTKGSTAIRISMSSSRHMPKKYFEWSHAQAITSSSLSSGGFSGYSVEYRARALLMV